MKKRVLIAVPNDNLGGAEQYLKMVAEYLYNEGYSIDVFFLKKKISGSWDELVNDDFNLYFTNKKTEKFGVLSLFKKLALRKKDVYHYAFTSHVHMNSFVALLRKLRILNIRYHIGRESTSIFKRYTGLKLFIFKTHYNFNYGKLDLLICQSDYMKNQLKEGVPKLFTKTKIEVIPNPVNLQKFQISTGQFNNPYSNYIVSAGRLIKEKGFDILIDAFKLLQKSFPDMELVIFGEGALRSELESKITQLNLQDKVFLPGFTTDIYHYFREATLCVVSSRIGGFPNVLLQMMAQNSRVVSTLCAGGIADIAALVTSEATSDSLHLAMKKCLTLNSSIQNREIFDLELSSRSIDCFIKKVNILLNE